MNTNISPSISLLPSDCVDYIVDQNNLSPRDINSCIGVSREWRIVFSRNDVWQIFLNKMGVKGAVENNLELYTKAFYTRTWSNAKTFWATRNWKFTIGLNLLQVCSYKPRSCKSSYYSIKRVYDKLFYLYLNQPAIASRYIEKTPILAKNDFSFIKHGDYYTIDVENLKMSSNFMKSLIIKNDHYCHTSFFIYRENEKHYFFYEDNLRNDANRDILINICKKIHDKANIPLFNNIDTSDLETPVLRGFYGLSTFPKHAARSVLELIVRSYKKKISDLPWKQIAVIILIGVIALNLFSNLIAASKKIDAA